MLFNFVEAVFANTPLGEISLNFDIIQPFVQFIAMAVYFFPWDEIKPIIYILIGLQVWRVVVSLLRTIWDAAPFT